MSGDTSTTFGFSSIAADARQGLVNGVFSRVASRYDLMNDLMSGGLHRAWKNDLINWMAPPVRDGRPHRLIDVAGGTADIALRYASAVGRGGSAVVADISGEMLEEGVRKANDHAKGDKLTFVQANAEALPFPDRSFDCYTIAFGIRNVTYIERAIAEAYRVLKPGGRFLCLEFSEVRIPGLDALYDFWSFRAIPELGALTAGDRDSYTYLVESIRRFPDQESFVRMISAGGFARVSYRNLSGGIAAMHSGWRI
ncbi:MAG: bifunctional demethylmenaquinone methyltransferase/2-methoxy-6-polyprenyl-1,4-benzoquinol methylase UbiE [Pseudomonadota bacterium]